MKLFILGLLIIAVATFFTYRKKIKENLASIENTYLDDQEERYGILGKGDPDATLVPQGQPGAVDFIKIANDLTTSKNYMKIGDAKFTEAKIEQALPRGEVDVKMAGCRSISKCSQLNNGDCGYCLYTNEFKYGGSGGPGADVCPDNAWTNNPDKCQEMREKAICEKVKSCGGLVGEAADLCGWCPTSGKAMPFKQSGNKKVPKYPDDICNNQGYGILDGKDCAKFARDHPCLTPTAYSGPLSPTCLSGLWKKAIGANRKTIDWVNYAKNKNAYWNTIGMNKVLSDMKAWKAYTKSKDYKTAVTGYLTCYGTKPDPCSNQFQPKPNECLDELWKKGGGETAGTGLPSKAGTYKAGDSPYKNTIGGYQYTLAQAKEACNKEGARLCKQSEIMDLNICNAGWTANGVRGYPMASGGSRGCGGPRKGWRTWSTDPNNKGSAHCCYEFNRNDSKSSIIDTTKGLAQKALTGDRNQQAGYMKMVYGRNWTPPPPPKKGDTVEFRWKEGSINAVNKGIVTQKLGRKCSIMWISYKGATSVDRYSLKNDEAGIKQQRYQFGWPGIPSGVNMGPNVDAAGLILENHLNVKKSCEKAPSACGLNCRRIVEAVLERFPIPQDCVVNNWSSFTSCNKTCGGGIQSRSRGIKYQAKYGGKACPPLTEKRMCNTEPCYPKNYMGCFKDCNGRDLPTNVGNLTKSQCADKARELNFKYYGLQNQDGVGGGKKDLAECWLGNTYGKQEPKNSTGWAKCTNIGPSTNTIAYGQKCSNAVYKNENYKPCTEYEGTFTHYTHRYANGNPLKIKVCGDKATLSLWWSHTGKWSTISLNATPTNDGWGYSFYRPGAYYNKWAEGKWYNRAGANVGTYTLNGGTSINWGSKGRLSDCTQFAMSGGNGVGPYRSSGGGYLRNACSGGYDKGHGLRGSSRVKACAKKYPRGDSVGSWQRAACGYGQALAEAENWQDCNGSNPCKDKYFMKYNSGLGEFAAEAARRKAKGLDGLLCEWNPNSKKLSGKTRPCKTWENGYPGGIAACTSPSWGGSWGCRLTAAGEKAEAKAGGRNGRNDGLLCEWDPNSGKPLTADQKTQGCKEWEKAAYGGLEACASPSWGGSWGCRLTAEGQRQKAAGK